MNCPKGCEAPPRGKTVLSHWTNDEFVVVIDPPDGGPWFCWHMTEKEAKDMFVLGLQVLGYEVHLT